MKKQWSRNYGDQKARPGSSTSEICSDGVTCFMLTRLVINFNVSRIIVDLKILDFKLCCRSDDDRP